MGMGLLDSLIAEGGVKSRDLSWVGVVIEIRRARSDRNVWLSLLHFLFRRNFLCSLVYYNYYIHIQVKEK